MDFGGHRNTGSQGAPTELLWWPERDAPGGDTLRDVMPDLARRSFAIALLMSSACRGHAPLLAPLAVELTGCAEVRKGPVCELAKDPARRELKLWIEAQDGSAVAVRIDGRQVEPRAREGNLFHVAIPPGAADLEVRAARREGRSTFRLPLATPEPVEALQDADQLRKQGRFDEAKARLATLDGEKDLAVRARVKGLTARVHLATGAKDEAIPLFEEAIALDREAGRVSGEFLDRFALAYTFLNLARFSNARRALEPLHALGTPADGHAMRPYYEGLLAHETGDVRSALSSFREAAEAADRLKLGTQKLDALVLVTGLLQSIGRDAEARALLDDLQAAIPEDLGLCKRAELLHNLGWLALATRDAAGAGRGRDPDPVPLLEEACSLFQASCRNPSQLGNALTTLAHAKLVAGDPDAAVRRLDEARRALEAPDPRLAIHWASVDAEVALARGEAAEALDLFERVSRLGASAFAPAAEWRGAVGRGQALEKMGRLDEARLAYEAAEKHRDERRRAIPFGEGRSSFLGSHDLGARLLVDLLVRQGRPADAARAARKSRALSISSVEWVGRIAALSARDRARWDEALMLYKREREALDAQASSDWKLSAAELTRATSMRQAERGRIGEALDRAREILGRAGAGDGDLAPPRGDELFLVYHPIREGWMGLAVSATKTVAHPIRAIDPESVRRAFGNDERARVLRAQLAEVLVAPFEAEIQRVDRLRVLAHGALDPVDFHALPHKGAPLSAALPVVYGADVTARAPNLRPARLALVVADPHRDLPAARREARRVASTLEKRGWKVTLLEGEAATVRAVRRAIEDEGVALLHYAGHGLFGGRDAAGSGLPLAGGSILDMTDILALARAPRHVVLSGCETARAGAGDDGFGLSHAFLIAGAETVIGATRPVDDQFAEQIMLALYEATSDGGLAGAPAALARIELEMARARPGDDWASFRVLVP